MNEVSEQISNTTCYLERNINDIELKNAIFSKLEELQSQIEAQTVSRITAKLNRLYGGNIHLPQKVNGYINLSQHVLTKDQKLLLSLGVKCHIKPKFDPLKKQLELEMLFESLHKLQERSIINMNPNIREQLKAEATKNRDHKNSTILTKELRVAAKQLKEHPDVIVRRADKSNIFVVMDKSEYKNKLDHILSNRNKFERITRNPVAALKTEVNKLIAAANRGNEQPILKPIVGEYSTGYIYGTVKIHKPGNPLRPIISQVSAPTYETAKQINNIITPYLPTGQIPNQLNR
jgi:hypothetical protein